MTNWNHAKNNTKKVSWEGFNLPNVMVFKTKLDQNIISRLWSYVDEATENHNIYLAGNISESLKLVDKDNYFFDTVLSEIVEKYSSGEDIWYRRVTDKPHHELYLDSMWVNYQNQTEFNPCHDHSGLFSFVIWMKIPTDYRDQHDTVPFAKHCINYTVSNVEFHYSDILGSHRSIQIQMSPKLEGWMFLFPSQLKHQVYPFYNCEDPRISISGNISFKSESYITDSAILDGKPVWIQKK